jgi:hypothetical protein
MSTDTSRDGTSLAAFRDADDTPLGRAPGGSIWDDGRPTAQELGVVDWLLTTTRSNRRTLDLERPVEPEVIEECLRVALQAPTAHNDQRWHFIVVTDPEKRARIADVYARVWEQMTRGEGRKVRRWKGDEPGLRQGPGLGRTGCPSTWPRCRSSSSRAWSARGTTTRWSCASGPCYMQQNGKPSA